MDLDYTEQRIFDTHSVIKNAFAVLSIQLLMPALNFALSVIIGRSLGVAGFGQYAALSALIFLCQNFQTLYLQPYITKHIAADKLTLHKYASSMVLIGLTTTFILYIGSCLYVNISNYDGNFVKIFYVYALTLFSNLGITILATLFIAYEKVKYNSYGIILGTVLGLAATFLATIARCQLNVVLYVLTACSFITLAFNFYLFIRYVAKLKFVVDAPLIKTLLGQVRVFGTIAILISLWRAVDIVILSKLSEVNTVGLYAAGKKFGTLIVAVPYSISLALFPVLSKNYHSARGLFETFFMKFLTILLIITLPLMILTIFLTDKLLFLVYGKYFAEAAFPMRIIVCSAGFIATSHQISDALIIAGKQKYDLIALLISVVFLVACGITLTAQYGGVGMAYSYLATCISLFVFHYYFFVRHVLKKGFLRILIKPGVSAAVMALFIYLLRNADIIVVFFFSLIIYGMMLLILRVFTKQDIAFFRGAFTSFFARHDRKVLP